MLSSGNWYSIRRLPYPHGRCVAARIRYNIVSQEMASLLESVNLENRSFDDVMETVYRIMVKTGYLEAVNELETAYAQLAGWTRTVVSMLNSEEYPCKPDSIDDCIEIIASPAPLVDCDPHSPHALTGSSPFAKSLLAALPLATLD